MSEQKRTDRGKRPSAQRSRRSAGVDQFKVYGDDEDVKSAGSRRGEKTPKRKKKKKSALSGITSWVKERSQRARAFFKDVPAGKEQASILRSFRFWLLVAAAIIVTLSGMVFLENKNLSVDAVSVTIVGLDSNLEGYRILLLSDLNGRRFGDKQSTLLRQIGTMSYDIVVMTGDMVGPGGDPEPLYELLEGLPNRKKVYFICGDSDPGPYRKKATAEKGKLSELVLEDWILGAIDRGAIYIDRPTRIATSSTAFWVSPASLLNLNLSEAVPTLKEQMEQEQAGYVSGIQADHDSLPFTSYRYEIATRAFEALTQMTDSELHIALSHVPPSSAFIQATFEHGSDKSNFLGQPDLILGGHYCGGVWRIPFYGAFYKPNSAAPRYGWFPSQESVAGLSTVGETQMYISRGLSTCSDAPLLRFRLFNRPQISLLTLTATLPSSMLED